jgi:excisionase family DNA binding protein
MQADVAPMAQSEWLDVASAAREIAAGTRTIVTAIQRGELRACAINGRGDRRIHRSWLMEWMNTRARRG